MIFNNNFEKISESSYVWHNFLSTDISDEAFFESEALSKKPDKYVREIDGVELLGGDMSQKIVDKVEDLFKDTNWEYKNLLHWYVPKDTWFAIHRDDEGRDTYPFKKVWSAVIYLSDMDGGELFYPIENITIKPIKGDLVIHKADCPHGATPVTGDNKRTITFTIYDKNHPIDPIDIPDPEQVRKLGWEQVCESTEWLNSPMGLRWRKQYNVPDDVLKI